SKGSPATGIVNGTAVVEYSTVWPLSWYTRYGTKPDGGPARARAPRPTSSPSPGFWPSSMAMLTDVTSGEHTSCTCPEPPAPPVAEAVSWPTNVAGASPKLSSPKSAVEGLLSPAIVQAEVRVRLTSRVPLS